jgi:hypothetical protein
LFYFVYFQVNPRAREQEQQQQQDEVLVTDEEEEEDEEQETPVPTPKSVKKRHYPRKGASGVSSKEQADILEAIRLSLEVISFHV